MAVFNSKQIGNSKFSSNNPLFPLLHSMPFRLFQFSNFFIKKTDFTFSIRLNKQKTKIGRHSRPWLIFGQLTMACFDLPMGGWNGVVFNSNPGIEVYTRVFILTEVLLRNWAVNPEVLGSIPGGGAYKKIHSFFF